MSISDPVFLTTSLMIDATTSQPEKESSDKLIISKLEILRSLLSVSIPVDTQVTYSEGTIYKAAFDEADRDIIKDKIMTLIDLL